MPPYLQPHWSCFTGIPHTPQGAVGSAPASWAQGVLGITSVPGCALSLPTAPITRAAVRGHCASPTTPGLFGYVCAMAWGGQENGAHGPANAKAAWASAVPLQANLNALRTGGLTRRDAYLTFEGTGKIPGLGPSFFTKLLFFSSLNVPPGQEPYIVDNVILRSVALLTGLPFHCYATAGGYQACCEEIDAMAALLGIPAQYVEERLFCRRNGPWRKYVTAHKQHLPPCTRRPGYRQIMHRAYPHIPIGFF